MTRNPKPPDDDEEIWRYIPDEHFLDLFQVFSDHDSWVSGKSDEKTIRIQPPGRMWLSFPRCFEDHWEAQLPRANETFEEYCQRRAKDDGLFQAEIEDRLEIAPAADADTIRECNLAFAQLSGVSCWSRISPQDGGWSLLNGSEGVAVRSTVSKVLNGITLVHGSPARMSRFGVTSVGYIDHYSYLLKEDGYKAILACVNQEHAAEDEVRFVADSPLLARIERRILVAPTVTKLEPQVRTDYLQSVLDRAREALKIYSDSDCRGFHLPLNLDVAIEGVVLDSDDALLSLSDAKQRIEARRSGTLHNDGKEPYVE